MVERGTKPNSSMMRSLRRVPLQVEQPAIVSGLHELVDQGRGGGEAYGHSLLAGGQAQTQGHVGLAGATVADGDDILPMLGIHTGQFHDQFTEGMASRRRVQAFDGRETGGPDPALHHALVSVNEFHRRDAAGSQGGPHSRRRTGRPVLLPEEGGKP